MTLFWVMTGIGVLFLSVLMYFSYSAWYHGVLTAERARIMSDHLLTLHEQLDTLQRKFESTKRMKKQKIENKAVDKYKAKTFGKCTCNEYQCCDACMNEYRVERVTKS